jgi:hypothetical protein
MYQATGGLAVFENGEIITALLFNKLNFKIVVDAKVELKHLVHMPAKLVTLQWRYNTQQTGIVEKIIGQVFDVEL